MADLITPPRRTSELVVARMEHLIASGEWPVDTKIPAEPELVERFGVGRNTIREAVRALEHAGMLTPRRGDGTYVRCRNPFTAAMERNVRGRDTTDDAELLDLLQVRRGLEAEAAASAAERSTATDRRRLRAALRRTEQAYESGDLDRYARADIDFHTALVEASGNALLIELYAGVTETMNRTHRRIAERSVAGAGHPVGHADVVTAIADSDAAAARAAVYDYLNVAESGVRT